MSVSGGEWPRTVWDACLLLADLLTRCRVRREDESGSLTPEQHATWVGDDRALTLVLVAAALHRQATVQGLDRSPQMVPGLWLRTPGPPSGGADHLLRYAPYETLREAPDQPARGSAQRAQLLGAAADGLRLAHPDSLLLWQRVHAAALAVVEGAVGTGRGGTLTMCDVIDGESISTMQRRLVEFWGPED